MTDKESQSPGRLRGYLFAALAAASYGTNPAFAVPLYDEGMNPNSVLLFRYLLGIPVMALVMRMRGLSFRMSRSDMVQTAILGFLMALSSLALFESYRYINSGIASTLLFVYPVMVAVIMTFLFHERFRLSVAICLAIMGGGLALLMKPSEGGCISLTGILLVAVSSLTYALYLVLVNVSRRVKSIPTSRLLFYVLCWGSLLFGGISALGEPVTLPSGGGGLLRLSALALIPTVISLGLTSRAIQLIGSTSTAILGSLEPISALLLSIIFLGQSMTPQEMAGAVLIILAATIVVADKQVDRVILHVRKFFPRRPD